MKIKGVACDNFASFQTFNRDLSDRGLTLIYGPTGVGKSTIMDMVTWGLYGVTAKDGSVDDIRPFNSPTATQTCIHVGINDQTNLMVIRIRGTQAENDLYWYETPPTDDPDALINNIRGKDLKDTQKLLEKHLGVTKEEFLMTSYYHEFSPTRSFFTDTAKHRRELLETLVNLELPTNLGAKLKDTIKTNNADLKKHQDQWHELGTTRNVLEKKWKETLKSSEQWTNMQSTRIEALKRKDIEFQTAKDKAFGDLRKRSDSFEANRSFNMATLVEKMNDLRREDIKSIQKELLVLEEERLTKLHCGECGQELECQLTKHKIPQVKERLWQAKQDKSDRERMNSEWSRVCEEENPFLSQLEAEEKRVNTYKEQIEQAKEEQNPFISILTNQIGELEQTELWLNASSASLAYAWGRSKNLSHLQDLLPVFRAELLKKAIKEIEVSTNKYLETYFDAEIRVGFTLDDSDNLDISVQKSGYEANYRQLSKGQRCLLRLCFSISVMKASANKIGKHFDTLFFDEALDGLDSELKIKAFTLFEALSKEHASIYLIDHAPEFQSMFSNKIKVSLEGDVSVIEVENEE